MHWARRRIDPADPALPAGAEPLADHVKAPAELARRLAQIGLVDARARRARIAALLKPGQRLVSREGDLWRWDGFAVAANAPTGAARRLAGKNRLADIEAELEAARTDVATPAAGRCDARRSRGRPLPPKPRRRRASTLASAAAGSAMRRATRYAEAERAGDPQRGATLRACRGDDAADGEPRRNDRGTRRGRSRALAAASRRGGSKRSLRRCARRSTAERAQLAEARAQSQALAREAEMAARRLAAIAAERAGLERAPRRREPRRSRRLAARIEEATRERAASKAAPRDLRREAARA